VFDYDFAPGAYDCVLIGFLLNHLPEPDDAVLFETVRRMLRPSGRFLALDSAWTELRATFNQKVERLWGIEFAKRRHRHCYASCVRTGTTEALMLTKAQYGGIMGGIIGGLGVAVWHGVAMATA